MKKPERLKHSINIWMQQTRPLLVHKKENHHFLGQPGQVTLQVESIRKFPREVLSYR